MGKQGHGGSGLGTAGNEQWQGEEAEGGQVVWSERGTTNVEGQRLPNYTKHASGVRFKAVLEEVNKQLQQNDLDNGYNSVIASPHQLHSIVDEVDGLGEVIVPDLHVLHNWQKEQPRPDKALLEMEKMLTDVFHARVEKGLSWVDELLEKEEEDSFQATPEDDANADGEAGDAFWAPTVLITEEEARRDLESLKEWRGSLKPKRRAVHLVEKHFGYECPWWDSPNALVRVWGQLDCALQVFSDERMVRDLVEVLGREVVTEDTQPREGRFYGFAYLTENAGRLKKMIWQRYAVHAAVLDAIIRKQDNNG